MARNLKKRQLETVQSQLVQGVLGAELYGLAGNLQTQGLLGISPQRLEEASRFAGVEPGGAAVIVHSLFTIHHPPLGEQP